MDPTTVAALATAEAAGQQGQPTEGRPSVDGALSSKSGGRKGSGARVTRVIKQKGELLSEEEKKANHIASEQKRRQNIRTGYDQLIQIVPTLTPSQRSEALILQKTVEYIKYLLMEREILEGQLTDIGQ
ncbi:Transcription factor [Coemansia biformis]|uniref:Transcription factor n=1 Tax=Coemansia biformis TaxID=1286918 RepID=A0A9W8CWD8_9FUNG|nr:Transcription factor [Coemansia biformis]